MRPSNHCVLIPAHNEERSLAATLEQVLPHAAHVIVVNDGSTDATREIAASYPVEVLSNEQNQGLARAVARGLRHALADGHEIVVKIDADGQMNPAVIPVLVEMLHADPSIDIAVATCDPDTPWALRKDLAIYAALYWLASGHWVGDLMSEFRAYRRPAVKSLLATSDSTPAFGSPLLLMHLQRTGHRLGVHPGGVSYAPDLIRPASLPQLLALRRTFLSQLACERRPRGLAATLLAVPTLYSLLCYNLIFHPRYHRVRRAPLA